MTPEPRLWTGWPAWLRWPRRTARSRLTALYGGFFVLSGAVLAAITYVLFERATEYKTPHLPRVPDTPAIQGLLPLAQAQHQLAKAQQQLAEALPPRGPALPPLAQAQYQLTQAQQQLARTPPPSALGGALRPLAFYVPQLAKAQQQLAQAQHQLAKALPQLAQAQRQLAQAQHQLAQAVHQVARAGPVEAAQRAADSHHLLVNSGIALAIVAVLALLAGWLVAGRILRPIRTITSAARSISSTNLHERLALDGPKDELKELGDTLDDLFERLDAAFEAQRHFVANASHELRTPLTRERTLVQVALGDPSTSDVWRSTAKELLASNREQETLIEALLTLATSESGLDHSEPVDLAVMTHAVVLDAHRDSDRLGIHIDTTIAPAPLEGDPRLLEPLVANLVKNAITHNVQGGRVEVSTGTQDGTALLTVANTGPVIDLTEIDRLFQPFQRLGPHRIHHNKGHGLGLSIVRAIATAHGATITALPSLHGGISIEVAFPPPSHPQRDPYELGNAQRLKAVAQSSPTLMRSSG